MPWPSFPAPLVTGAAADPGEGPGAWPPFEGPLERIPVGRTEMIRVYGELGHSYSRAGEVRVSRSWERANMITARGLPGYVRPVYVHRLVEPYLREALRRAAIAAPEYRIQRLGCFAPRHQRHDRSRPLSDHSWGIAVDIDAERNAPKTTSVECWSPGWTQLWAVGLPRELVEAFESTGWEWGGRWRPWADPMHFQLRRTA